MFKQALAVGTLVASTLTVGMTVSAQPAGASAAPQQISVTAGSNNHDPFGHYSYYTRYTPFFFYNNYVPFGYHSYYRPVVYRYW